MVCFVIAEVECKEPSLPKPKRRQNLGATLDASGGGGTMSVDTETMSPVNSGSQSKDAIVSLSPALNTRAKARAQEVNKIMYKPPRRAKKTNHSKVEVRSVAQPVQNLLAWGDDSKLCVAKGMLRQDFPKFHGKEIPEGNVVVMLSKVIVGDYPLPFPNTADDPPQEVLEDAAGTLVLWPLEFLCEA